MSASPTQRLHLFLTVCLCLLHGAVLRAGGAVLPADITVGGVTEYDATNSFSVGGVTNSGNMVLRIGGGDTITSFSNSVVTLGINPMGGSLTDTGDGLGLSEWTARSSGSASGSEFMLGVDQMFSLTNASPMGSCPNNPGSTCEVETGPMGTLRARLGYARDDWMVYVTGGAAASKFELNTNGASGRNSGLHGWTVGAGGEYLLGDIVGVKLEYRYLQFGDFGSFDEKLEDSSGNNIDVDMHVIMGGINFHF